MTSLLASDLLFFGLLGYIGLFTILAVAVSEARRYQKLWYAELQVTSYLCQKPPAPQPDRLAVFQPRGLRLVHGQSYDPRDRAAYDIEPQT